MTLFALTMALAAPATARPLSIKPGESWAFQIAKGDPAKARRVPAGGKPAKGEIMVTVRAFLGTMLTATNNSGRSYRFRAELIANGRASLARSCALPATTAPIIEQWPGKTADAVRISAFVPAKDGSC